MIYDMITNSDLYGKLHPGIVQAFNYIKQFNKETLDGRYVWKKMEIIVLSYVTRDPNTALFETHRDYIDVQYIMEGVERLDTAHINTVSLVPDGPYDGEKDLKFFKEPELFTPLVMTAGMFAVLYPQDAHRPNCNLSGSCKVRKICMKVRMTLNFVCFKIAIITCTKWNDHLRSLLNAVDIQMGIHRDICSSILCLFSIFNNAPDKVCDGNDKHRMPLLL